MISGTACPAPYLFRRGRRAQGAAADVLPGSRSPSVQASLRWRRAQQLHYPLHVDHHPGEQILDLHAPLPPVPTPSSSMVPHDIRQLAFDAGMLLPYLRIARCLSSLPDGIILRLIIVQR